MDPSSTTLDAFVVDAVRTPMGRYRGVLAGVRPDDLAAHVIRAAVERTGLDPEAVRDVYWGAANQSGEDNRDAGRMASLLAGLPVEVPGVTVNRLCASGLEAINQASRALRLGEGDLYLAGGAESMSRAPWVVLKPEAGLPRGPQTMHDTALGWRLINPLMAERYSTESMGETAENVAERYGVTARGAGPLRAPEPRRAPSQATREGRLRREMIPVEAPPPVAGATRSRSRSTRGLAPTPRWRSSPSCGPRSARAAPSPPATRRRSTTARPAWSSTSGERAEAMGAEPLARIVSIGVAGVDPAYMGIGPIPAIRQAVDAAGMSLDEVDLVEINEAFAAQVLACIGELGIDEERLNVNGGAIALGHPLGLLRRPPDDHPGLGAAPARRAVRDRGPVRRRRPGRRDGGREPGGEPIEARIASRLI